MGHYKKKFAKPEQLHETPMVIFKGEDDLDANAPRREFYSMFFQCCLTEETMWIGQGRRLVPTNDITKTKDKQFSALGVAIVEAIVNGDCGFPYLHEALYHFIIGDDNFEDYLRVDDIPDPDILNFTQKLMNAKTDDEITKVVTSDEGSCIDGTGWPSGPMIKFSQRDALVRHLAKWSVIERRRTAIDQLKEGLNYKKFLNSLKTNKLLKCLLVYSGEYCVTANYLRRMLSPALTTLKVNDKQESDTKKHFNTLLENITDEEAGYLFFFITGVLDPPINEMVLTVTFNPNRKRTLPEAAACCNSISLPQGNRSFEEFKKSFVTAIQYAHVGFGKRSSE
ncbi:uncharacterized protein [Argopecten irradians]